MMEPFVNEPLTDFGREENKKAMLEALAYVKQRMGAEHDLVIGGEEWIAYDILENIKPWS